MKTNVPQFASYSQDAQENIRNRVFRVFVSSTFSDMQRERNRLVLEVFPRIRKLCKERDVEFVPIDLRWGVTDEQAKSGKTVGICLREIQRSRPFFIGLLGERYGWAPEEKDVFEQDLDNTPFLRDYVKERLSVTEIEFRFGVLREKTHMDAGFWLRSEKMETPVKQRETDPILSEKLARLKEELSSQKKHPVAKYDSPEDLGAQVEKALLDQLDKYFPKNERLSWLDKQNVDQDSFERSRTGLGASGRGRKGSYVANKADYDTLDNFVKSEKQTLAVVGDSGLGKSALLANWKSIGADAFPNVKIISHYVSASEHSDLPANILRRLTESLDPNYTTEKEPRLDLKFEQRTLEDFSNEFAATIAQYLADNPEKSLLFILDGLNQLSETDDAKELSWLPRLPDRARYLLSTVLSDQTFDAIKRREWNYCKINALDESRRLDIIQKFLEYRGRTLTSEQADKILKFKLASNPLVLKTFLDELCFFGSHSRLDKEIERYANAENIDDFFAEVYKRLESNEQFIETNAEKRKEIVKKLALLVALSRFGLSENELGVVSGFNQLIVSTFLCALDAQLVNRSGRYSFAHAHIRQAVLRRYADKIADTRRLLIDRFLELPPENERRLQEVPFQYLQLQSWEELRRFLLDFDVLERLYNSTFNCNFCMYWNAAVRKGRKKFKFASYLKLDSSDFSSWFNLAHIADRYQEFSTAEEAYQKALDFLRKSTEENSDENKSNVADTLNNLAILHKDTNHMDDAEKEYKEALEIYRELARGEPKSYSQYVAATLNNLALLHSDTNQIDAAEEEYKAALEIYRKLAEEEPKSYLQYVATTLNNLANLHSDTNCMDATEKEYKEALEIRRELARENPKVYLQDVAMTLNNWALHNSGTNHMDDAEKKYKEALKIRRKLMRENPKGYFQDVATTLNNLAALHSDTNRIEVAEKEYKEALKMRRELARENPKAYLKDVATTLNNLANLHSETNRMDTAEKEYKEALEIRRELARENPNTYLKDLADTLNNLALLHSETNRMVVAEKEYKEVLEIRRELLEVPQKAYLQDLAMTLNSLALLHSETNRMDTAEGEYKEALEITRELVRENPNTYLKDLAGIQNNLANLYYSTNRMDDAEKEYKEALEITRGLARENPKVYLQDVADALNNLAIIYSAANHISKAEKAFQGALEIYRELVKENPKAYLKVLAGTLNNLALHHSDTNHMNNAEKEYKEALEIRRELARANPKVYLQDVATTLNNWALLHYSTNHMDDAEKKYKEALKIRRELARENPNAHKPDLADTLFNMTIFYYQKEKFTEAKKFISEAISIYSEFASNPFYAERLKKARSLKGTVLLSTILGKIRRWFNYFKR